MTYKIYFKEGKGLRFDFPYSPELITEIKSSVPGVQWDKEAKRWYIPEGTILDDKLTQSIKDFAKKHRFEISEKAGSYLGVSGTQTVTPDINIKYNTKDKYDRDSDVTFNTTPDKQFIAVKTPYDDAIVSSFHYEFKGAKFDKYSKKWLIPIADKAELDTLISKVKRVFPETISKSAETQQKREQQVKSEEAAGIMHVHAGEGYGGHPYKVGEVFRDAKGQAVKVLEASSQYYREDGMSFGVGDERGNVYFAKVKPATEEEAKPLLKAESVAKDKIQLRASKKSVADFIQAQGQTPPGDNEPEGNRLFNTQSIYGGGDWFTIGKDYIWYVQNNGADGDDWSQNNVRTGGAGAIGWRVPYNEALAKKLLSLEKVDNVLKTGEEIDKNLKDTAFTAFTNPIPPKTQQPVATPIIANKDVAEKTVKTELTSPPTPSKQPWEMTKTEFIENELKGLPGGERAIKRGMESASIEATHKQTVETALKEGKAVPQNVLKDYPELAKSQPVKPSAVVQVASQMAKQPWQMTRDEIKNTPQRYFRLQRNAELDKNSMDQDEKTGKYKQLPGIAATSSPTGIEPGGSGSTFGGSWDAYGDENGAVFVLEGNVIDKLYDGVVLKPSKVVAKFTKGEWDKMIEDGRADEYAQPYEFHKEIIQRALSEGKSVPPEILKDYPELAKAAPTQPTLQTVQSTTEPLKAPAGIITLPAAQTMTSQMKDLEEIHNQRTPRSKAEDETRRNKTIYQPDDKRVSNWVHDPGSADVSGIDTKNKAIYKPTPAISKPMPPISKRTASITGRKMTRISKRMPRLR